MTKNEKLKQSRQNKGLTQAEFASMLGVKQAYISGLETTQTFGIKKAKEIAKILDVDPVWLYNDDKIDNELSQKSNIASKAINELLGNNPVENSDITLREPGEVNQRSNFHLGGGGGSAPTHSKELLQLIDNQQKQIDLLYQNADLLRSQVALLNNLVAKN